MNDKELQKLVEELSSQYFNKPFKHKARFNHRLRTTGGRYLLQSHDIEINKKYYDELGIEGIKGIIKHELCHYHLHIEGKGYKHRDKEFRDLLKLVDAPRFCQPLKSVQKRKSLVSYLYECQDCGQHYKRKRKIDTSKFVCGACKGKLRNC